MKHFYYDENWLFDDYQSFLKNIGGYHNVHTNKLYDYWEKNLDENLKNKIYDRFDKFQKSSYNRLTIFDSEKEEKIFRSKK